MENVPMSNKRFLTAKDVCMYMEVSRSMAYKIIKELNDQLEAQGYLTVRGKVSRIYFEEKTYTGKSSEREAD